MASHRHFLLADKPGPRAVLAEQLAERFHCTITEAETAAQVRDTVARGVRLDALVLEVRLQDGDGRDLCRQLRAGGLKAPVLMLTSAAREGDVVWGLDAGANDYLLKPCRVAELAARLRAQLRSFETSEHAEVVIGPYLFRPGSRVLQGAAGERPTRLTEKEALLLKFLYRAQGRIVSRDTLLHEVWGYSAGASTHTVETHIYRLRRKIEPNGRDQRLLVNEGGGYRLCHDRPHPVRRTRRDSSGSMMALAAGGP